MNEEELDLKVGLEIHQQLAVSTKLFCNCQEFNGVNKGIEFVRRLRPTQSELGEVDPAAQFEASRSRIIRYKADGESACLVEADEEPPHSLSNDVLEIILSIALLLKSEPIDEVHVMRKIVIDGSNTTGFQRTLIVALGGELRVGSKTVPVQAVALEEDAARILEKTNGISQYGLDRLCIPLVEVALAPVTGAPDDIEDIALALGRLMRSTKRVARGLGTIRQDVNVSIKGGNVVEVKGVQKLNLISKIVEFETKRQWSLLEIAKKLKSRIPVERFEPISVNVSDVFKSSESKLMRKVLNGNGAVFGIKLPKFRGVLGYEPESGIRLGKEMADLVKFYGFGGIFHSDELPAYGINEKDVSNVSNELSIEKDDAFILLAGVKENMEIAISALKARSKQAFEGVPPETRGSTIDGQTKYIRPKPGSARMYPETDIPPIAIDDDLLNKVRESLPPPYEEQIDFYRSKYSLSDKLARQIYDSDYSGLFDEITNNTKISPSFIAATLTETLVSISRETLDNSLIDEECLIDAFTLLDKGMVAKEAIIDILTYIAEGKADNARDAIEKLSLSSLTKELLDEIVRDIVEKNKEIVRKRRDESFSILMGKVMEQVRGKADGKVVSSVLRETITNMMEDEKKD